MLHELRRILILFVAVLALADAAPARAQQDASNAAGEVLIEPVPGRIGVGGRPRPGEMTPFAFVLTDRGSKEFRNVLLRLEVIDIDGDQAFWSRPVTTTRGKPTPTVWIYARLPYQTESFTVSVFEAIERPGGDADDPSKAAYVPGRRLGTTDLRIGTGATVNSTAAMMLIVGSSRCGLDPYAYRLGSTVGGKADCPPLGHEIIELFPGVKPADLPDRALGLRGFDAIVWTGSAADQQPAKLDPQQADVIRKWVASGGHLIIVLPAVGQTWINSGANPLSDLMPLVDISRDENFDLGAVRTMLTRRDPVIDGKPGKPIDLPSSTVLQYFEPDPSAGPYDAMPILATPKDQAGNQRTVVVRRLYNAGAITVIGLDLNHPALTLESLRADFFWHRVLGRRGRLVNPGSNSAEVRQLEIPTQREPLLKIDDVIDANIQRNARSAGGLLLALAVFGAFWVVACPLSYFILKTRRLAHHAWLAFAGSVAVFTGVSWTGASLLRQRQPDARFVAIIDHVYGQPMQRARVWANLFLPDYGTQRVSVAHSVSKDAKWRPAIVPWEPSTTKAGGNPFPDVRGYSIDSRSPESIPFPTRSTEKRVEIDWLGPPRWSMPLPAPPDAAPSAPGIIGNEIQLQRLAQAVNGRVFALKGSLTHNLPGPLQDVIVVIVGGQSPLSLSEPRADLLANAEVWSFGSNWSWNPGEPLHLETFNPADAKEADSANARSFLDRLMPTASPAYGLDGAISADMRTGIVKYLRRITFFSMLPVPITKEFAARAPLVHREETHSFDLGRWFTQPCVIVLGHLTASECPVPIEVDGAPIHTSGHTMVRWVFPLTPSPPEYPEPDALPTDAP
ncbi:MAG: hypothetical protein AB7G11_15405 [Phycisphaerales bacterium]